VAVGAHRRARRRAALSPKQLDAATGIGPFLAAEWAQPLEVAIDAWGVRSVARFLAQVTHESARFTRLEENLRYTKPERLQQVWPRRFPTRESALPYVNNPEGLANLVYANRMGNGPTESGDGWFYRGRGLKMITGRDNYQRFAEASGGAVASSPWMLQQRDYAAHSAAWFWSTHDLDKLTDVRQITRVINGGEIGLDERIALTDRALAVFA
jgi:putative chitinase